MKLREFLLHIFVLASATAWELFLAYNAPRLDDYYIKGGMIHLSSGVIKCWREYSPSLTFVILVLLPALVLLVMYLLFKKATLKKSGLAIGVPVLLVVLVSLINPDSSLLILPVISVGVGAVLGEEKGEKALLAIEGLLPGFVVITIILSGLAVSC
ncbi:hypothetical protein CL1_0018 [Thermococcus cleftensis]|uniref:Uncharacterized protein n=1 Tax=Thermococcus cleftensis (strain DSM 27260 / KACC 17922 / CL1) TaxID=163003 RepID=I3ZR99_THECF|nr:hypothetical protein [Thermococcus cleftensis]AFL94233.1 hypothetical protein CL1_0018 [Thermococcus cleftensis]